MNLKTCLQFQSFSEISRTKTLGFLLNEDYHSAAETSITQLALFQSDKKYFTIFSRIEIKCFTRNPQDYNFRQKYELSSSLSFLVIKKTNKTPTYLHCKFHKFRRAEGVPGMPLEHFHAFLK